MSLILVVDDNAAMRETLREWLQGAGHEVEEAADGDLALQWLAKRQADALVTDLRMPGLDGLGLLEKARVLDPGLPVLLITAHGGVEEAVKAMRLGAEDFLVKPFPMEELDMRLERALARRRLEGRRQSLELEVGPRRLLGSSPALLKALSILQSAANAKSTVLIEGESGTGKELAAKALHDESPRKDGPFISVHCAALSPGLLESELFGHEKGAFTGAVAQRSGRFELAQGGTLFLDEVSEIPAETQVKLLRVLQEREFERVGGTRTLKADFRLVAASNRDLAKMVEEGKFRQDLYYRLNVVPLRLPSLRERPEDLEALAESFGRRFCSEQGKAYPGLDANSLPLLRAHRWPGNVRELQNLMEQAVVFCKGEPLMPVPKGTNARSDPYPQTLEPALDQLEKEMIQRALKAAHGIQAQAASKLGVSRSVLQYKIRKHSLEHLTRSSRDDDAQD